MEWIDKSIIKLIYCKDWKYMWRGIEINFEMVNIYLWVDQIFPSKQLG